MAPALFPCSEHPHYGSVQRHVPRILQVVFSRPVIALGSDFDQGFKPSTVRVVVIEDPPGRAYQLTCDGINSHAPGRHPVRAVAGWPLLVRASASGAWIVPRTSSKWWSPALLWGAAYQYRYSKALILSCVCQAEWHFLPLLPHPNSTGLKGTSLPRFPPPLPPPAQTLPAATLHAQLQHARPLPLGHHHHRPLRPLRAVAHRPQLHLPVERPPDRIRR